MISFEHGTESLMQALSMAQVKQFLKLAEKVLHSGTVL